MIDCQTWVLKYVQIRDLMQGLMINSLFYSWHMDQIWNTFFMFHTINWSSTVPLLKVDRFGLAATWSWSPCECDCLGLFGWVESHDWCWKHVFTLCPIPIYLIIPGTRFFKKNSHLMLATLQRFRNPAPPTSKLYYGLVRARLQKKKKTFVFQPRATRKQHWEEGDRGRIDNGATYYVGCFFFFFKKNRYVNFIFNMWHYFQGSWLYTHLIYDIWFIW